MATFWGLKQAAQECGVSFDTVKRRLPALIEVGAHKNASGAWRVTPVQLMSVGLTPGKPSLEPELSAQGPDASIGQAPQSAPAQPGAALQQRINELEARAREAEQRAVLAEARLEERAALVEGLTLALRAIESRRPAPADDDLHVPDQVLTSSKWWRRRRE